MDRRRPHSAGARRRRMAKERSGEEKGSGKVIRKGYMKICVNGVWWQWVEREEKMEKMFFGRKEEEVLKAVTWNIAGVGMLG